MGCPRSGTTALVDILNAHPAIVVGMERFKYLYSAAAVDDLDGIFEPCRFLDVQADETNVLPLGTNRWQRLYDDARAKFAVGGVQLVGDKLWASQAIVTKLHQAYPEARWVFIFRDLARVAASFEVRANNPHDRGWPLRNGYRTALQVWMGAFRAARLLEDLVADTAIYRVAYERFFAQDLAQLAALQAFLGVGSSSELDEAYVQATRDWDARQARPHGLFPAAREWLEHNRPAGLENRFRRAAEQDAREKSTHCIVDEK
jgi:hypothetical protein